MPPGAPADEWADLVDEHNRIIGRARRRDVRGRNLLHRGVGVLCTNPSNDVYVHRRTDTKDVFPGLYDMFVGGMVAAGETYGNAARRETAEELGVTSGDYEFLFSHFYDGDRNRAIVQVYRVSWDGPIVHQESEIAWGEWIPHGELEAWAARHPVVPDGAEVFEHYLQWLRDDCPPGKPLP